MARGMRRDRLASVVENLLTVDDQYRVAVHELADLGAQTQRMDRDIVVRKNPFVVARPPRVPPRESLAPRRVAIGIPLAGRAQHLERRAGIGDHPEVEARARVNLSGVDVDSDELCVRMKTWEDRRGR